MMQNEQPDNVKMRNGKVGMKYLKNGEAGWTPVVRRKRKKTEDSDGHEGLNIRLN